VSRITRGTTERRGEEVEYTGLSSHASKGGISILSAGIEKIGEKKKGVDYQVVITNMWGERGGGEGVSLPRPRKGGFFTRLKKSGNGAVLQLVYPVSGERGGRRPLPHRKNGGCLT